MATTRYAYVQADNKWGQFLSSITVRHLRSNDIQKSEEKTWNNLSPGDKSPDNDKLKIMYETGWNPDRDCWFVTFVTSAGETYASKNDFRCNITSDDENGTIVAQVDVQGSTFRIIPSSSSSCATSSISKV